MRSQIVLSLLCGLGLVLAGCGNCNTSAGGGAQPGPGPQPSNPPQFQYNSPVVCTAGETITIPPISTGGPIEFFTLISPLLPPGITLNTSTGVISGTCQEIQPPTEFFVRGTNQDGTDDASVIIEVIAPPQASQCVLELSFTRTDTVCPEIDICFLLDDSSSFDQAGPAISGLLSDIISDLAAGFSGADLAFAVTRFEDYGGDEDGDAGTIDGGRAYTTADDTVDGTAPGNPTERPEGRPFFLDQAMIRLADGGEAAVGAALALRLPDEAALGGDSPGAHPGFGGDSMESWIEALFQIATGNGFDGDGDGNTRTVPTGTETGDVPNFLASEHTNIAGTLAGVGWRDGSCKVVLVAADGPPVAPVTTAGAAVNGEDGVTQPINKIAAPDFFNVSPTDSTTITPGVNRYGFVGDAKDVASNTVANAIAPLGAATVQAAVDALNALDINVAGIAANFLITDTGGNPVQPIPDEATLATLGLTPPSRTAVFALQAMARLTGSVFPDGTPVVFGATALDDAVPPAEEQILRNAIVDAINAATIPVDLNVVAEVLSFSASSSGTIIPANPPLLTIAPDSTGNFRVTLTGDQFLAGAGLTVVFRDGDSGNELGSMTVLFPSDCVPSVSDPVGTVDVRVLSFS